MSSIIIAPDPQPQPAPSWLEAIACTRFSVFFTIAFKWLSAVALALWVITMASVVTSTILWTVFGFSLFAILRRLF